MGSQPVLAKRFAVGDKASGNSINPKSSVVLADSEPIFLSGLQSVLAQIQEVELIGTATDTAALKSCLNLGPPPNLLICGFVLACGRDIISVRKELNFLQEATKFLAMVPDSVLATFAHQKNCPALAVVRRAITPDELRKIILKLLKGTPPPFPGEAVCFPGSAASIQLANLSHREREILRLIGQNQPNKLIAAALGISIRTVETHRLNIKNKLGLSSGDSLLPLAARLNRWEQTGIDYWI